MKIDNQAVVTKSGLGPVVKATMAAAVMLLAVGAFATPALADRDGHGRGPDRYHHDRHWHGHPRPYGYYQPAYAAPPPVVYAPPPQPAGINLIVPLHIR